MEPTSRGRTRAGGAAMILCALTLAVIGVILASAVFDLPSVGGVTGPGVVSRLTEPAGLALIWLAATVLVTLVMGLDMLVRARRTHWLLKLFLILVAIFVGAGIWAAFQSGGRVPRLYL